MIEVIKQLTDQKAKYEAEIQKHKEATFTLMPD
jgi:hypothetical protein